jgi:hypothetical protein
MFHGVALKCEAHVASKQVKGWAGSVRAKGVKRDRPRGSQYSPEEAE